MKLLAQQFILLLLLAGFTACEQKSDEEQQFIEKEQRIISLSGTITETLFAIGRGQEVVGVDVTSTYPLEVNELPKLGHTSSIKAEGIISLNPTHVLFEKGSVDQTVLGQLKSAGIVTIGLERDYTIAGTKQLISKITEAVNVPVPEGLIQELNSFKNELITLEEPPKVLFIYGRGAGNLMVAGEHTSLEKIIEMAGGKNAVSGFDDFKPLSNEVLIEANPDYILLFESAKSSLNGIEGLLEVPGIANTKAGMKQQFIFMDGQLLSGFGPRLGQAVLALNKAIATKND